MTTEQTGRTDFSAGDSALGYLYQVRLALLSSLKRLSKGDAFSVYIESLDDVVFDQDGSPVELLQLKHHRRKAANLTDASPDLWKTLRVWMEGRAADSIPSDGRLFLVTTEAVGDRSAASLLLRSERNVEEASRRLAATATTSSNRENRPAYALFRALDDQARAQLLEQVTILPLGPSIEDVGEQLRWEIRLAVRRDHVDSFLIRLEGWWFDRAIRQMSELQLQPILSEELESEVDDLREQFKLDSLPVDRDLLDAEVDAKAYEDSVFVHQAKLAGIGNRRVLAAIRDYYRAFEQRSRWVREDLLLVGELVSYEKLLCEEWELEFDRLADELGEDQAEESKQRAAQAIYHWVEKSQFAIRDNVKHPSMSRGSLHILADRLRVGWHPDFLERLKHLLEPTVAS